MRFGDADLGPRGFALFFHSFRHTSLCDVLGIPKFEMSRNELKVQEEHEQAQMRKDKEEQERIEREIKEQEARAKEVATTGTRMKRGSSGGRRKTLAMMQDQLKMNRRTMKQTAMRGVNLLEALGGSMEEGDEEAEDGDEEDAAPVVRRPRSQSTEDYEQMLVNICVNPAPDPFSYLSKNDLRPSESTTLALAEAHLEIAKLYGQRRFNAEGEEEKAPDAESATFHVCQSAALGNPEGCVLAARLLLGLGAGRVCEGMSLHCENGGEKARAVLARVKGEGQWKAVAAGMLAKHYSKEMDSGELVAACEVCLAYLGGDEGGEAGFEEGDAVTAAYGGGNSWYSGVVRGVKEDGTVNVYYPEDDEDEWLPAKFVKKVEAAKWKVGDVVEGAFGGGDAWYEAEVRAVDGGNITVFYLEDQEEEILGEEFVRAKGGGEGGGVKDERKLDLAVFELYAVMGDAKSAGGDEDGAREFWSKAGDEAIKAGKSKLGMELKMKAEA
jgi:hypothetical protein